VSTTVQSPVSALPETPDALSVTTHRAGPVVVVSAHGDVDAATALPLRDHLRDLVRPHGPDLVLDLTAVTFFGGAGLTVLTDVRAAAHRAGIGFRVLASTRAVLVPLRVTGMDTVLDVLPIPPRR